MISQYLTVSVVIIRLPSCVVLLRHDKTVDKWLIPSGQINDDESPFEAVLRHIREQTGLLPEQLIERNNPEKDSTLNHHDLRFVFCYTGNEDLETFDYKWVYINDTSIKMMFNVPETEVLALEYLYDHRDQWRIPSTPKGGMLILAKLLVAYKSMCDFQKQKHTLERLIEVCAQIVDSGDNSVLDRYAQYLADFAGLAGNISLIEQYYAKAIEVYQQFGQLTKGNLLLSVENILKIHTKMLRLYCDRGTLEKADLLYEKFISYYNGIELKDFKVFKLRIAECYCWFYKSIIEKVRTEKLLLSIVEINRERTSTNYGEATFAKSCMELADYTGDRQLKQEMLTEAMSRYEHLESIEYESYSMDIIEICSNLIEIHLALGEQEQVESLTSKIESAMKKMAKRGAPSKRFPTMPNQ